MEFQHVNVKLFVDGELTVDPAKFIDVFHAWVKDQLFDGLLIDVADYRHVPAGPGVLLVGLEADYAMDHASNRWGLRYNRKTPLAGSNEDRFRQALGAALNACRLLEAEFAMESKGFTAHRHQMEVGTGYFDEVLNTITGGEASTGALSGSTESDQFKKAG